MKIVFIITTIFFVERLEWKQRGNDGLTVDPISNSLQK